MRFTTFFHSLNLAMRVQMRASVSINEWIWLHFSDNEKPPNCFYHKINSFESDLASALYVIMGVSVWFGISRPHDNRHSVSIN